jgi:hypothetical protein
MERNKCKSELQVESELQVVMQALEVLLVGMRKYMYPCWVCRYIRFDNYKGTVRV